MYTLKTQVNQGLVKTWANQEHVHTKNIGKSRTSSKHGQIKNMYTRKPQVNQGLVKNMGKSRTCTHEKHR